MLAPTKEPPFDAKKMEQLSIDLDALMTHAEEIFLAEASNPELQRMWSVKLPFIDGLTYNYDFKHPATLFGRQRWWEHHPYGVDEYKRFRLLATAPPALQEWETWQDPEKFLELLKGMYPMVLTHKLGSTLAALQMVVDVWDHLQIRCKFPRMDRLPAMIALLSSATSLLRYVLFWDIKT